MLFGFLACALFFFLVGFCAGRLIDDNRKFVEGKEAGMAYAKREASNEMSRAINNGTLTIVYENQQLKQMVKEDFEIKSKGNLKRL